MTAEDDSAAEGLQFSACLLVSLKILEDSSEQFTPESCAHQRQAIYCQASRLVLHVPSSS